MAEDGGPVMGCFENVNETSGIIKLGEFLNQLGGCWHF
jgi:hypothetical protein